jgi:phenylalanyl-tRNA synthetase beta chain
MSKISFDTTESDFFSEGLTIKYDGSLIGKLGVVKNSITSNFNIENQVCICEIKLDGIYDKAFDLNLKIKDIPKFPSIQRDFSLLINQDISFSSIKEIALNTEKKFLESVDLFDVYEGEKISNSKKSYGIRFTFTDMKKTLTDKHIDKVMDKLLKEFQIHLNAELR